MGVELPWRHRLNERAGLVQYAMADTESEKAPEEDSTSEED